MTPEPCPFCGNNKLSVIPRTCEKATPYDPADRAYPVVRCRCGADMAGKNWTSVSTAIEAWNRRAAQSAVLDADARSERMESALQRLQQWADAYPLDIFPAPDFKRAAEVLKAHGMTLDAISASCMRHVIGQTREIVSAALAANPPATVKGAT